MRNVARVLADTGKVGLDEARAALQRLDGDTDAVWHEFVSSGLVTEKEVFSSLARLYNQEFVDISELEIPSEALSVLPGPFCRSEKVIPLEIRGSYLFIGMDSPQNFKVVDEISSTAGYTPVVKVVTPTDLKEALNRYFRADDEIERLSEVLEDDATAEEEEDNFDLNDDSPIIRFANLLIFQAIRDRASDIHVEPGPKGARVRYRIDGVLHEVQKIEKNSQLGIISRLKLMSEIDIAERRKPQDGRMTVKYEGQSVDIRVVTLPTVWGEKLIMRILDQGGGDRSIDTIGMSEVNQKNFISAISKPQGMVLVTGPTGSGKSTTLYTALGNVAKTEVSVVTVEDPVEKRIPGVDQVQINARAGNTISNVLKFILRADPDVVFVGEIRDEETAALAIEASMTGHLVLSTLHTNSAPAAAARLIQMGVEPYLVGDSVSCIVAQRLARKLCEDCKVIIDIPEELMEEVSPKIGSKQVYKAVGCKQCSNIGYKGRIALTEVMIMNPEIEKVIMGNGTAADIRKVAAEQGMASLRDDGWAKVSQGITTIEEVFRTTA